MLDPSDPPEVQVQKQSKIIDALIRRSNRQRDVGPSAFRAFQSALELQQTVADQTRDLERAATELESARYDRERTRRILAEALSSMDGGFALFSEGRLELCNEIFRTLLPDIESVVQPGLDLDQFLQAVASSAQFVSSNRALQDLKDGAARGDEDLSSVMVEVQGDRWYQFGTQRSADDNLIILMTDITGLVRRNRDEKESLLDQQADYLRAVFRNMNAGICTFSAAGDVMMHNGRFPEILGVPHTVVDPGTNLSEILNYVIAQNIISTPEGMFSERWRHEMVAQGSFRRRVTRSSGQILDIEANRLPDSGFVIEVLDVTLRARNTQILENRVMERTAELTRANEQLTREYAEKARVEEELRLAKERAEAAVSSKTRFLAAASHDLLQPINAARLLISTLRETTSDSAAAPLVDRLEGAFGSAERLLHSLLDISRLESPDPDAVTPLDTCLRPILESVYADQSLFAEQKGVRLDVVLSSAFVHTDAVYLLRSIQNLVVNAIQNTPPGGRVVFGCRRRDGHAVLEVWDTGIGIPAEDQKRIFEEFARAKGSEAGTGMGLGLSVVDRACRHLGHELSVRSSPGVGSVFTIAMQEVAGADLPLPVTTPQRPSFEEKRLDHIVLVIENDGDVLDGMTRWLELWGASVLAANSIAQATEFVDDMGISPDIILADYQLDQDETGIDAIIALRARTHTEIPAVLITANRSKSVWRQADAQGVTVMLKPAELPRLRQIINAKISAARAE